MEPRHGFPVLLPHCVTVCGGNSLLSAMDRVCHTWLVRRHSPRGNSEEGVYRVICQQVCSNIFYLRTSVNALMGIFDMVCLDLYDLIDDALIS